jgi:hypothetical protein
MKPLRTVPLAIGALAISTGVVAGFSTLPTQATTGLEKAAEVSGRALPARPDVVPPTSHEVNVAPADLPAATGHGADVSAVASGDDPTPDTNRGADVSAVAKDNHGQAVALTHRPASPGKPDNVGKPAGAGKPDAPGIPTDPGPPDGVGRP